MSLGTHTQAVAINDALVWYAGMGSYYDVGSSLSLDPIIQHLLSAVSQYPGPPQDCADCHAAARPAMVGTVAIWTEKSIVLQLNRSQHKKELCHLDADQQHPREQPHWEKLSPID